MVTRQFLEDNGYMAVRQMKDGRWIGLLVQIFTVALCVDLEEFSYHHRYCYEKLAWAMVAIAQYEGEGDPIGPWIKRKGVDGERLGPGAKGDNV